MQRDYGRPDTEITLRNHLAIESTCKHHACFSSEMSQSSQIHFYDIERSWVNDSNTAEYGDAIESRIVIWGDSHARSLLGVRYSTRPDVGFKWDDLSEIDKTPRIG